MLAFGYQRGSEAERPEQLREVTLLCSKEELNELIKLLTNFRDDAQTGDHQHFRDWSDSWDENQSDFIIVLSDE